MQFRVLVQALSIFWVIRDKAIILIYQTIRIKFPAVAEWSLRSDDVFHVSVTDCPKEGNGV